MFLSQGKDRPATIVVSHCQRSFAKAERIFLALYQRFKERGLPKGVTLELIPAEENYSSRKDNPSLIRHLREADIIVNATYQGMDGRDEAAISQKGVEAIFRSRESKPIVIDIIHRREDGAPLVTYLLREAYRRGITTVYNGLSMWYENIFLLALSCLNDFVQTASKLSKITNRKRRIFMRGLSVEYEC